MIYLFVFDSVVFVWLDMRAQWLRRSTALQAWGEEGQGIARGNLQNVYGLGLRLKIIYTDTRDLHDDCFRKRSCNSKFYAKFFIPLVSPPFSSRNT